MANLNRQTATITANAQECLTTNADYVRTFVFDVSGTFVATVRVETSVDGETWRPISGSASILNIHTGAFVASGNVTGAGTYAVDVSSAVFVRIKSTAYTSGTMNLLSIVTENGNLPPAASISTVSGTVSLGTGTASIGTVTTPTGSPIAVTTTASTNASIQKASAGNLFEISVSNPTATPAYVKLYNKTTAPTVGTDIPVLTIVSPANSATSIASANGLTFGRIGKRFSTGIAMAVTAGPLATDTAAAVAGVQIHGTYV